MNGWTKTVISAIVAGVLAGAGALLVAAQGGTLNGKTWLAAGCVALIAAAKDVQAFLSPSPTQQ